MPSEKITFWGVFFMSGNVKKFKSNKGYESINRNMLQDVDSLSLQAIGLLSNLTSMPDNWTIYKTELYKRYAKNARTSVQSAWNELVENRYIVQFRKRVGKKYEYMYYHAQERFTDQDIIELEEIEGSKVWNGKVTTKDSAEKDGGSKVSSNVENQQSSKKPPSTVDFEQSKLDSPKSTDSIFTSKEILYQNLDTIDTTKSTHKNNSLSDLKRIKQKEQYMERAFYDNSQVITKKLADMLNAFSESPEVANEYYKIILLAKKNAEIATGEVIWLENEPELEQEIINAFSRSIRKIEKEQTIKNTDGYIYKAVHDLLVNEITARQRFSINSDKFYNWLEE